MEERLQKLLARCGVASRRQAEQLIVAGRVRLNGEIVTTLGLKADLHRDRLEVDNQAIQAASLTYLMLHKPVGVLCTRHDPQRRPTIFDLLPLQYRSLHSIGRLDWDSSGLLLLTNDGALTQQLAHPRHHVTKTYEVAVRGMVSAEAIARWQAGVCLEGRLTQPATVRVRAVQGKAETQTTLLHVELREGRNRQIRKVAALLGLEVVSLHRTAIAGLSLGALPPGAHRLLRDREVRALLHAIPTPAFELPPVVRPTNSRKPKTKFG